jgi:hypothetical protein
VIDGIETVRQLGQRGSTADAVLTTSSDAPGEITDDLYPPGRHRRLALRADPLARS